MLTYTKTPDSNLAEIVVDGKISDDEMNAAMTAMKADLDKGGKIKLLEDIRAFQGMEPAAFFKDPRFGFSMMKGVSHVALVTDAGTPAVSDPGFVLLRECVGRGLDVEVLPGPSAAVTALVASALPADRWRFAGFLPRKAGPLRTELERGGETLVAFESPGRLPKTLALLAEIDPARDVAVCRELTKLHEEVVRGPAREVAARFALAITRYFPGRAAKRITAPVLFCVCDPDTVAPTKATLRHAAKAPRGQIEVYPYGHFDIYVGEGFERVVADQVAFLTRTLPVSTG